MYDPLVVDTFIRVYSDIAPRAIQAGQEARSLFPLGLLDNDEDSSVPFKQIRANASEAVGMGRLQSELLAASTLEEKLSAAAQCLRETTVATVFAYFEYERRLDHLCCTASCGPQSHLLKGFKIRVGERVSGWSAATRRTSLNSDAALDLRTLASAFTPPLKSTASSPVLRGDVLLGVLCGYSTQPDAFPDETRYSLERVAAAFAESMVSASNSERERLVRFPGAAI
jgi:GAF domain-containing protein